MTSKSSIKILIGLTSLTILFHLAILLGIISPKLVWGGRVDIESELYIMEIMSLFVSLYFLIILLIHGGFIGPILNAKVTRVSLWFFLVFFSLNTIGNALATTNTEKLFAIPTLVMSILLWTILRKPSRTG